MSDENPTPPPEDPDKQLQERILADCPRLGPDDTFNFACHPGVSCFNRCCGDVNIFLSPYDVLRMKKRLDMKSSDFLEKYTLMPVHKDMRTPVVMLRMNDDEAKTCPFVTEGGCNIYSDRPWPCRMYPLGLATQKDMSAGRHGDRFYFLLHEEECKGYDEQQKRTVRQWFSDQGIDEHEQWGDQFKELTLHGYFEKGGVLSPEKMHMFFTACYDLDRFREFVFNSTLLQRFDVSEDLVEEMRYDDEGLLRFAFQWLRFSLFGEKTMKPMAGVVEAFKGKLDKKDLFDEEKDKDT
ncbi:MAG: YkgJ family cysteine cluster protein [Planctomycetota bacterium]|jgi:Fe-S-cluster containining protein